MKEIILNSKEEINTRIIFNEGIAKNIDNVLEDFHSKKKYFLITNTKVAKLYSNVLYKFHNDRIFIIKDGEKYKTIKTYLSILDFLLSKKIERDDCIVALGGGVVGDIAGYAASTVLRGVELIQIPTTLLAMCDSSVGGKTGVNSKFGKNLIGSFYNASKVLIDISFLSTLPEYEYKCGLGEVLKYAFIEKSCKYTENFDLINYFITNQKDDIRYDIENTIEKCIKLKAHVTSKDRKESNLRKVLNFGHTFAHPIETLTNYKKISHGEAVALGIKYASKLSKSLGYIDDNYFNLINNLLIKFDLIQKKLKLNPNKVIELMKQDKKVKNENINLLLPVAPAQVELFDNINQPSLEASLL